MTPPAHHSTPLRYVQTRLRPGTRGVDRGNAVHLLQNSTCCANVVYTCCILCKTLHVVQGLLRLRPLARKDAVQWKAATRPGPRSTQLRHFESPMGPLRGICGVGRCKTNWQFRRYSSMVVLNLLAMVLNLLAPMSGRPLAKADRMQFPKSRVCKYT